MKIKKSIKTSFLVFLALGLAATAVAQVDEEADDDSDVEVQIASDIAVDIHPDTLRYDGVEPGERVTETSEEGFFAVEIENIGSENITSVWLNSTRPATNPFGSGVSTEYDAGNFIEVRPTGQITGVAEDTEHTFVNRLEYNESIDLSYIFADDDWRYGRFRINDQEVFWAVENNPGTDQCATGADTFRVGNTAHNQSNTGTFDFTDGGDYTEYELFEDVDSGNEYATNVDVTTSETDRTYDIVANCAADETWVERTKYNPEAGGVDLSNEGDVADFLLDAADPADEESLNPGENFEVETAVNVPLGVAEGEVDSGTLTVLVNTN